MKKVAATSGHRVSFAIFFGEFSPAGNSPGTKAGFKLARVLPVQSARLQTPAHEKASRHAKDTAVEARRKGNLRRAPEEPRRILRGIWSRTRWSAVLCRAIQG